MEGDEEEGGGLLHLLGPAGGGEDDRILRVTQIINRSSASVIVCVEVGV
jgi:hypothetical protein